MRLCELARRFFEVVAKTPAASRHLTPYPELALHLLVGPQRLVIHAGTGEVIESEATALGQIGEPAPSDHGASVGLWGLELEAEEEVFAALFDGRHTLGEAIYAGVVFVPEEKSKHNLVAAVGQAIRVGQEAGRTR